MDKQERLECSNIYKHAERELIREGLLGEDSKDFMYGDHLGNAILELVEVFVLQGHSGMSAELTINLFSKLARHKNISPITSDPNEWDECEVPKLLYQNNRNSACFSTDGGKNYYNVHEDKLPWYKRIFVMTHPANGLRLYESADPNDIGENNG